MEVETKEKLRDIITDSNMKPISVVCDGSITGCPKMGLSPCIFIRFPTTTLNDMVAYVSQKRNCLCEVPIDYVMDNLKGY